MLLKKMTLVQAHIRGKRTDRGGWDSSSPTACISISCECSAGRWRYRPRSKWGRHRLRLRPPRKAEWRQWRLYDRAPALAAPAAHSLAGNRCEGRSRECRKQNDVADLAAEFTAVVASEEGTIVAAMLEHGAIPPHTYQMIKILRAAQEPFLETSREIFVHHQFSNLPAK
jgi:hypothetical protein